MSPESCNAPQDRDTGNRKGNATIKHLAPTLLGVLLHIDSDEFWYYDPSRPIAFEEDPVRGNAGEAAENCVLTQLCTLCDRHDRGLLWAEIALTAELGTVRSALYSRRARRGSYRARPLDVSRRHLAHDLVGLQSSERFL